MKKLLFTLFLFYFNSTIGQTEFRNGAQLALNLPFKSELQAALEDRRTTKGFSQFQTDWELKKRIIRGIDFGLTYRMAAEPSSQNFIAYKHRFGGKFKINFFRISEFSKRMDLSLSLNQQWNIKEEGKNTSIFRSKIQFVYDIKNFPISPIVYVENFYCWNENTVFSQNQISFTPGNRAFRQMTGFEYEFSKKSQLAFLFGADYIFRKSRFETICSLCFKHQIN